MDKKEEQINSETIGVKLDQSKSRFAKKAAELESFDDKAKQTHEYREARKAKILSLGQQFIAMTQSKILSDNKGPQEKANEKQILKTLTDLALEIEEDEAERIGMGPVTLMMLMFSAMLKMRDNYNRLEYKFEKLLEQVNVKQ